MEFPKMMFRGEATSQEHFNWLASNVNDQMHRVMVSSAVAEEEMRALGFKLAHEFTFDALPVAPLEGEAK